MSVAVSDCCHLSHLYSYFFCFFYMCIYEPGVIFSSLLAFSLLQTASFGFDRLLQGFSSQLVNHGRSFDGSRPENIEIEHVRQVEKTNNK